MNNYKRKYRDQIREFEEECWSARHPGNRYESDSLELTKQQSTRNRKFLVESADKRELLQYIFTKESVLVKSVHLHQEKSIDEAYI